MKVLMVLLGLVTIASSLSKGSHKQNVVCGTSKAVLEKPQDFPCQFVTINDDYSDHVTYTASSINYCEFNGTFVFYSETNFKGNVKYGFQDQKKLLSKLEPENSVVTEVKSIRVIGDKDAWDADTLTLFRFENFNGDDDDVEKFSGNKVQSKNLPFIPASAIATGRDYWTFWCGADCNEQYLEPFNRDTAEPVFRTTLPCNITQVKKGRSC